MSPRIAWLTTWLVFTCLFVLAGLVAFRCLIGLVGNQGSSDRPFLEAGFFLSLIAIYGAPVPAAVVTAGYVDFRKRKVRLAAARIRAGKCPHCGYDMRGSTSGICPECGHATAAKARGNKD